MGQLTSTQMQTELARRVTQLSTGVGSAAETAISRAIRWINRRGSYTFQRAAPTSLVITGGTLTIAAPSDLDAGKAIGMTNPSGLPIRKGTGIDLWEAANYNLPSDEGFSLYWLTMNNPAPHTFNFRPSCATDKTVGLVYHKIVQPISGSSKSNLPDEFDDLVIDLAEAEERRINDVGDTWATVQARCQEEILKLLDGYRSVTIETGLASESAAEIQEETQVGRP
jgi:hypothetical protein